MRHILALTLNITNATSHKWQTYLAHGMPLQALDSTHQFALGNFYPAHGLLSPAGNYFALAASNAQPYLSIYNFNTLSTVNLSNVRPSTNPNPFTVVPQGSGWSHDDRYFAVQHASISGSYLSVIDTSDWSLETVPTIGGYAYQPRFNYNSTFLAVPHSNSPFLTVLNTSDWSVVAGTPVGSNSNCVEWSPDGSKLAIALAASPYLKVYNTSDWSLIAGTPTLSASPYRLRWSPDGAMLAYSLYTPGSLIIYNTSDWTVKHTLSGGWDLDFSADSAYIASGIKSSPYLMIYDTTTGTSVSTGITVSYALYGISYSRAPMAVNVTGVTKDANDLPASFVVRLYDRTSGSLFGEKTSDGSGVFSFNVVTKNTLQRVVKSSTTTPPLLNDLIDRVEPS